MQKRRRFYLTRLSHQMNWQKNIDINTIKADYMLLSHGHGPHVADAPAVAKNTGCRVIAAFEAAEWMGKQGAEKAQRMNTGGKKQFDFGCLQVVDAHNDTLGYIKIDKEKALKTFNEAGITLHLPGIGESIEL